LVSFEEIQAAYYMVAATGVLVAAIYYIYTMRINQRTQQLALKAQQQNLETRQAQLFMGIYQSFYSKDFMDAEPLLNKIKFETADDYAELQKEGGKKYKAFGIFGYYYEGMGLLVRENLVDIRLVSQLMSGNVIWYWERFGQGVKDSRREFTWPRMAVEVEYLYNRIIEYGKEHPELHIASPLTH
jgi:hypothetical protein